VSTSNKDLARRLRRVESRNVTYISREFPIFWERAAGSFVWDVEGKKYLDLTSAFGVTSLGHRPPVMEEAIHRQAAKLWHGMGDVHPSEVKVELLEALADLLPKPLEVSILSSSGAEAVESALKTARLYTRRPGVIAFEGGYHGLTYGAMAATHRSDFRAPFHDQTAPFVRHLPYPDSLRGPSEKECLYAVERCLIENKQMGAILVEPIQGRGGVRIPGTSFLKGLRRLATSTSVLLIVDEVFTGFGRTGKDFAFQHAGIVPDLVCVGKALANGFPISACIGSHKIMNAWPESDGEAIHTSTFLGNPLGCAMGVASLREFRKNHLSARSAELGRWWKRDLQSKLGRHPHVEEIRGEGLMIGIEMTNAARAGHVMREALKEGLLLLTGGSRRNVLTLTPPLTIEKEDLVKAMQVLGRLL